MSTYTLPADSGLNFSLGFDQIFIYVQQQFPFFSSTILFCFFIIIWIGGFGLQKKSEGRGDALMWFAIAGFLSAVLSFIMLLLPNFIDLSIVIFMVALSVAGGIAFILSKR